MMELSKRLQAVADMVTPGMRLADIVTDHAYIPIYLVEQNVIPEAIAMDINKGPLERAEEHIREYGFEKRIQTRLSDGLQKLEAGEADAMIAAGMGGALVIKILEDRSDVAKRLKELILQPQSELAKVRVYLLENGYQIVGENMVLEDRKYYPMMKVLPCQEEDAAIYAPEELEYGRWLLRDANPVLKQFLEREIQINEGIIESLNVQQTERAKCRQDEILKKNTEIRQVLEKYFK